MASTNKDKLKELLGKIAVSTNTITVEEDINHYTVLELLNALRSNIKEINDILDNLDGEIIEEVQRLIDDGTLDVMVMINNCAGFPLGVNKATSKNNLSDTFVQLQLTQLYTGTHSTASDLPLKYDITQYSMLFVSYGAIGAGTFQTEIVRPYYGDSAFKVGNKFTIGNTDKIIFSIKDEKTLSVEQIGAIHLREISAIFSKTIL